MGLDNMLSMDFNKDESSASPDGSSSAPSSTILRSSSSTVPGEQSFPSTNPLDAEQVSQYLNRDLEKWKRKDGKEKDDFIEVKWKKFAKHLTIEKRKCLKGLSVLVQDRKALRANLTNI